MISANRQIDSKKTAIYAFSKSPLLGSSKSRLRAGVDSITANMISRALFEITKSALASARSQSVDVFWAVEERDKNSEIWGSIPIVLQGPGELGDRISFVESQASLGYSQWIFIGSDLPAMNCHLLKEAVQQLEQCDFVLGPASDGGFYLFGAKENLHPSFWNSIPYSSSETLLTLKQKLVGNISYLPILTDLDVKAQFNQIKNELQNMVLQPNEPQRILLSILQSDNYSNPEAIERSTT